MLQDWRASELSPWHLGSIISKRSSSGGSFPWSPPTLPPERGLLGKTSPASPGAVLWLIAFVYCKLCSGLCPWAEGNHRPSWQGTKGPEPTIKHNGAPFPPCGKKGGFTTWTAVKRTKCIFFYCSQILTPSKAFKHWNKTDLASVLYLFFGGGLARGGERRRR